MTVAELLQKSVQAHMRAAALRHQRKPLDALEAIAGARSLRLEAIALDPKREDPAWSAETVTHPKPRDCHPATKTTVPLDHDVMLRFYEEQLGPA